MPDHDIIPDIHGQNDKLHALLPRLGWRRTRAGWACDDPARQIVFLGDFIDRGPDNAGVLRTVRSLIDAGKARAVMGNHELNDIHFHTTHPETGAPLRPHSEKNLGQHASFLREFPIGASETRDAIAWMATLPLFLETEAFRAVHACWQDTSIRALSRLGDDGRLSEAQLIAAADERHPLHALTESATKGPETPLPEGHDFVDKDGTRRTEVRIKWWRRAAESWADIAMSVPDPDLLPKTPLPAQVSAQVYPEDAKPVFFGHYWLTGMPVLQASNALCLDYSAGTEGPLLAYRWDAPGALDLANLVAHDGGAGSRQVSA